MHVLDLGKDKTIIIPPVDKKINAAVDMSGGKKITFIQNKNAVILYGLDKDISAPDLVIKLSY